MHRSLKRVFEKDLELSVWLIRCGVTIDRRVSRCLGGGLPVLWTGGVLGLLRGRLGGFGGLGRMLLRLWRRLRAVLVLVLGGGRLCRLRRRVAGGRGVERCRL